MIKTGIAAIILLLLDLLTKSWAASKLAAPFVLLPGVLELRLSFNTGVAFSIPIPNLVMIFLAPALLVLLVWYIAKNCDTRSLLTKTALSLIIAGGLGNFINRLWGGAVIDFIDFSFWPSFNFADAYLTTAVFLLIIFYSRIYKKQI